MHRSYTDEHYATTGVTRKGIINILYPRAELTNQPTNQLTPPVYILPLLLQKSGSWFGRQSLILVLVAGGTRISNNSIAVRTADHACFFPARTGVSLVERSKIKRNNRLHIVSKYYIKR